MSEEKDLLGDVIQPKTSKKKASKKKTTKPRSTKPRSTKPRVKYVKENINAIIDQSLAIEEEEAKKAGKLGYMARALAMATMPHTDPKSNEFTRVNGDFTMSMLSPSHIGLPFGTIPRLLMSYLSTEAVVTKSPEIYLGNSLSDFMHNLGMSVSGGKNGSINRVKEQANRLFATTIYAGYQKDNRIMNGHFNIAESSDIWFTPIKPDQKAIFESVVTLSPTFFKEVIENPIPIDMRALTAIKQSPLAIDIYCWLTYRMSYLSKRTTIPWVALKAQFGANYKDTPQGLRDFKRQFKLQLQKIAVIYPNANFRTNDTGFVIYPSLTHVKKR